MKKILLLLNLFFISNALFAQYQINTTHRPDGITLDYFNPVPVAKTTTYEAGLSLYKNTSEERYTISLTVLFKSTIPQELTGNLMIQTTGNNGISLVPIMHKLIDMNGKDVAVSIYSLTPRDVKELKANTIKMVSFKISDNIVALHLTENKDVLIKGFSILHKKKINTNITPINSNQDSPKKNVDILDLITTKSDPENAPMTRTTKEGSSDTYGYNTGLGDSKYDEGLLPASQIELNNINTSLEDYRSKTQPWYKKTITLLIGIIALFVLGVLLGRNLRNKNNKF